MYIEKFVKISLLSSVVAFIVSLIIGSIAPSPEIQKTIKEPIKTNETKEFIIEAPENIDNGILIEEPKNIDDNFVIYL